MSDLTPITREEALLDGADLEPITRKEQFIKRIYDKTQEVPTPITREEWFLKKAGEGGSEVTVEQLSVTENGTYREEGKAYSPVIVEVPEPTLITKSITANGTYSASDDNADGYSSVTVAVEGFKKKSIANTPTDIASFNDGTTNPMPSLEISIEPVQSGSGDPSPENVRPISGWSEANVTRCGVNVWDEEWEVGNINATTGEDEPNNSVIRCVGYTKAFPNTTYYIKNPESVVVFFYDAEKNFIDATTRQNQTFATPSNTAFIRFRVSFSYGTTYNHDISINYPSTDTSYHAHQGSTLFIPFHDNSDNPITVYGGTLNVTSGELRVTHTSIVKNTANLSGTDAYPSWSNAGIRDIVGVGINGLLAGVETSFGYNNIIAANTLSTNDILFFYGSGTPYTLDEWKALAIDCQFKIPLTTPQTYQLTPAQVSTLLGQNNIFADCGQVLEGEYFVTL